MKRVVWLAFVVAACGGSSAKRTQPTPTPQPTPQPTPEPTPGPVAGCDQSTPEGLANTLKALNIPPGDCPPRTTSLPNLVVLESFADDYGCMGGAVLQDCKVHDLEKETPAVLARLGWAKGDRAALARAFTLEVLHVDALETAPAEFALGKHSAFAPPSATRRADGGVDVVFWEKARPGMRPDNAPDFYHYKVAYAANGSPADAVQLESF